MHSCLSFHNFNKFLAHFTLLLPCLCLSSSKQVAPKFLVETTPPHWHHQGSIQVEQIASLSLAHSSHILYLCTPKNMKKTSSSFMMMANLEHTKKKTKTIMIHVITWPDVVWALCSKTTHFVKRFGKRVCILTLQCVFAVWLVEMVLQSSIIKHKAHGWQRFQKCAAQLNSYLDLDPHFGNCPTQRLF